MSTPQALALVFVAAFTWIGLTIIVLQQLRRRRRGSSKVASAPTHPVPVRDRRHRPWRRAQPLTGQAPTHRRLRVRLRRVRG
jgi:hypothetical protein